MITEPNPKSWRELVDEALHERHGFGVTCLIDPVDALVVWQQMGHNPERAAELDAVDLALGHWLNGLAMTSRVAYQSSFRFAARALASGPRGARQLLDRAIADAESFGRELEAAAKASGGKSGTIRRRIIPWSAAVSVLVDAGLATSQLGVLLPPKHAARQARGLDGMVGADLRRGGRDLRRAVHGHAARPQAHARLLVDGADTLETIS